MLEIDAPETLGLDVAQLRERLVVSPGEGRFHPFPPEVFTTEGEWISSGQIVAEVRNGATVWRVESFCDGWMMGMLALPGQPVTRGEALFWVRT